MVIFVDAPHYTEGALLHTPLPVDASYELVRPASNFFVGFIKLNQINKSLKVGQTHLLESPS